MPIAKSNGAVVSKPKTDVAQTAPAPVARTLATVEGLPNKSGGTYSKVRDFDAEARGKVACASYAAALSSPGLAGLGFATREEYLAHVRVAAEEMVKFTWEHQK